MIEPASVRAPPTTSMVRISTETLISKEIGSMKLRIDRVERRRRRRRSAPDTADAPSLARSTLRPAATTAISSSRMALSRRP